MLIHFWNSPWDVISAGCVSTCPFTSHVGILEGLMCHVVTAPTISMLHLCCGGTFSRLFVVSLLLCGLICGDIHPNPGPSPGPGPGSVCDCLVSSYGIQCDRCDRWSHSQCVFVQDSECIG